MPINYNAFVSEFVYEALQPDVPFPSQPAEGQQGITYYTFSNLYVPEVQQQDRTLSFGKVAIEMTISMLLEPKYFDEVSQRIRQIPQLLFPNGVGTPLDVVSITPVDEAPSVSSFARFRMLSPLVSPTWDAGDGREPRYVHYGEPEFSEAIRAILLAKYERWKGRRPQDTRFRIMLDEKYVQRRHGRISKLVTFHEGLDDERRVKAIVAPFEVEGNPDLIWLGYVSGFGEKNLLGFGCTEIISGGGREVRTISERPGNPNHSTAPQPRAAYSQPRPHSRPQEQHDHQHQDRQQHGNSRHDHPQRRDDQNGQREAQYRDQRVTMQSYGPAVLNHHKGGKFNQR